MSKLFNPATGSSKLFRKSLHPSLFEKNSKQIKLIRALKKIVKVKDTTEDTKPSVLRRLFVDFKPENKPQLYVSEYGQVVESKSHSPELEVRPQNNFRTDTQTKKAVQQINEPIKPIDFADSLLNGEYIHRIRPDHIDANHWEELVIGSGINPELASLNVASLSDNAAYDYLLYSDKLDRLNAGRLSSRWMNRYRHLEDGGWYSNGINLVDGSDSLWGCFKPNKPTTNKDGKFIKYEHPPKLLTECFFLKVSANTWELIAAKAGVALPDNHQDVVEQPLLFWTWVIENNIAVILTEGVKKTLAGLTAGYVCIGFPGITSICKQPRDSERNKIGKPHLIPQLTPFLGSKRKVIFAFDSDSKRDAIRNANREIDKAGRLLQFKSCSVHVASWEHQSGKGLDDILVNCGVGKIDEIYRNVKLFHEWKTSQLKQLTHIPNIELDREYLLVKDDKGNLKPDFKLSSDWVLLWLKAHKGAGKTSLINYLVSPFVYSGECKVLLITHRISLGKKICDDLGLQYIDEKSEEGHKRHLGLCIDSLLKLNPDDWKGCYLILDEIQQLKWHVLNSSTCRKKRVAILKQFKKLLNIIHQSGGKVIIADADLRDDGIDFISQMIDDNINIFGIQNHYIRNDNDKWKVYNYADKDPARLISDLIKKLEAGERIMLCTSGQKAKSTWGTKVLEAHIKKLLPDVKVLRVDSITVSDPNHPAFGALANFRKSIEGYQLVICSPTIETGISLDFDYFDCVFGIFQGVQSCDSVRQHLSRYRKAVPRYLYISPAGINSNKIGNSATSVKQLLSGEYRKDKTNVELLISMGFEENLEGSFENIYLTHWAICGALINDGFNKYRSQILDDLKSEGHEIIDLVQDEKEKYSSSPVKETRIEVYDIHLEKTEAAADISDSKLEELEKKSTPTEEERYQKDKAKLAKTYQIPVDAELARKNDDGWYTEIKRHFLINNFDSSLPRQDKNYFSFALESGEGHRAIWDDNKQAMGSKIALLVYVCKIKEVLATDGLHENHPLAVEVGNAVRANAGDLKLFICDFRDPEKPVTSNMFILRRLVGLIGYKLPQIKQVRIDKQQIRLHGLAAPGFEKIVITDKKGNEKQKLKLDDQGKAIPISDGREEVFAAWKAKELLEIEKENVEKSQRLAVIDREEKTEIIPAVLEHLANSQLPITNDQSLINDQSPLPELNRVDASVEFIRKCLEDNSMSWLMIDEYLTTLDVVTLEIVWNQLTLAETKKLERLNPDFSQDLKNRGHKLPKYIL